MELTLTEPEMLVIYTEEYLVDTVCETVDMAATTGLSLGLALNGQGTCDSNVKSRE